jgi:hypothetical protein
MNLSKDNRMALIGPAQDSCTGLFLSLCAGAKTKPVISDKMASNKHAQFAAFQNLIGANHEILQTISQCFGAQRFIDLLRAIQPGGRQY